MSVASRSIENPLARPCIVALRGFSRLRSGPCPFTLLSLQIAPRLRRCSPRRSRPFASCWLYQAVLHPRVPRSPPDLCWRARCTISWCSCNSFHFFVAEYPFGADQTRSVPPHQVAQLLSACTEGRLSCWGWVLVAARRRGVRRASHVPLPACVGDRRPKLRQHRLLLCSRCSGRGHILGQPWGLPLFLCSSRGLRNSFGGRRCAEERGAGRCCLRLLSRWACC